MYSDMSKDRSASSELNRNSASALESSVLPTPDGPRKMNEPAGRFGSFKPERERRMALESAVTASSWPMMRSCRTPSMRSSFSVSASVRLLTGTPVDMDTTSAMVLDRDVLHGLGGVLLPLLLGLFALLLQGLFLVA